MKKLNKIFLVIIVVLFIALVIVSALYIDMRKQAKTNLDATLKSANELFEANKKIHELEEKINTINNTINN